MRFYCCQVYVTDILKVCMKMFNAEKMFVFCQIYNIFNVANFQPLYILNNG